MIYISTGSDHSSTGYEVAKNLIRNDFKHIELSSGKFDANALENLISFISKCNFQVHHYFPPPRDSFVLNLASRDNHVCEKSYQFCKRAVDLCKQLNCKYYSVHAGYLLDPKVNDLGQKIGFSALNDRDLSKSIFIDQIRKLSSYASQREIKILIENNVITQKNLKVFGVNPLLMADHLESLEIVEEIGDNVGLLVDLAHLKVSRNPWAFANMSFLRPQTNILMLIT